MSMTKRDFEMMTEQMEQILDGAPDGADIYCKAADCDESPYIDSEIEGECVNCIKLSDIRAELSSRQSIQAYFNSDERSYMIVCQHCGNKRCPRALNHTHKCSGNNNVGQVGVVVKDAVREAFEKQAYANKWNIFRHRNSDEYVDDFVNGAWWAFKFRQPELDQLIQENIKLIKANAEVANINMDYLVEKVELEQQINNLKREIKIFKGYATRFDENTESASITGAVDGFIEGLEKALGGGV